MTLPLLPRHGYGGDLPPAPVMVGTGATSAPVPVSSSERSANPMRPAWLKDMIGQYRLRSVLERIITASKVNGRPMSHTLLVGPSGTGKSTIAHIIANELGVQVFQVEAPISQETLLSLRERMVDRDVLFIDEVHQQAIMERRGKSASTQPEVLFNVMEDRRIVSGTGVLEYPAITVVAATTDEGALPDAFVNRFPLRPVIDAYTLDDLTFMAYANAHALGVRIDDGAARAFARACRNIPRAVNSYVRNGADLSLNGVIDDALAEEVLADLNSVTEDGLTSDMQKTLVFMYRQAKVNKSTNEIVYRASVGTIARGIGKSRDYKGVELRVEPYLIERGYLIVGHGGRFLTDAGVVRARELLTTDQDTM